MIGVAVFFLAAGACVALYLALSPQNRAVDERFADLAVQMRASQGALDGDDQDDNLLRMLFRWAAKARSAAEHGYSHRREAPADL